MGLDKRFSAGRPLQLTPSKLAAAVASALLVGFAPATLHALPTVGQVVGGTATIQQTAPGTLTIQQLSQRAVVNWRSFSIGQGELTRFVQPASTAAILNRVTGGDPSALLGTLQANGQVYLINPSGILVGSGARIDTAAFVGSTLNVPDADFMGGKILTFAGPSLAGITNLGVITAREGDVVLVAQRVENSGSISAPGGVAALAAGSEVLLLPGGDERVQVRSGVTLPSEGPAISNEGIVQAAQVELKAAGGNPYGLAINNGGLVSATSVEHRGGRVVLSARGGDTVTSGTITARDGDAGGTVQVLGDRVAVTGTIDASGESGGGTVLVGGSYKGADPAIPNARQTFVGADARILADATRQGDGGSVVVWADEATRFAGTIAARGGVEGGNGGFVEVSGKALAFTGSVDLTAPLGTTGNLLLDPTTIEVVAGATPAPANADDGFWAAGEDAGAQQIGADRVAALLAAANLTLQAADSVTVNAPIAWSTNSFLHLFAPSIAANASITGTGPGANLGLLGLTAAGGLTSAAGATLSAATINISGTAGAINLGGPVTTNSLAVELLDPATSLSATNAANQIARLDLGPTPQVFGGAVDVFTGQAVAVAGQATAGSFQIRADGGSSNLTLDPGTVFTSAGTTTLAATGGGVFVNNAGAGALAGAGRKLIYTSSDANGFSDGGLDYPQFNPVTFGNDPQNGLQAVTYVAIASGLPLLTITANDAVRLYGDANPAFNAIFTGGDQTNTGGTLQFSTPALTISIVGTYAITPFGLTSSTHRLDFVNGTLTVTPALLTIQADNAARVYGDLNPAFTAAISGFKNLDTAAIVSGLQLATTATPASNVGAYPIVPSGATAGANYTIAFQNGTLTVTPANIVVQVNGATRIYGAADPAFSAANVLGLVGTDTIAGLGLGFTTTAGIASPVGTYLIDATSLTNSNYTIALSDSGTLTVTPAPLAVVANDASRLYGSANPVFSAANVIGLVGTDTIAGLDLRFRTTADIASRVGTYPIDVIGLTNSNYTIALSDSGTLTVTPAPLTVQANDAIRMYGSANPAFTGIVTGLVAGDTQAVLNLVFTTPAVVTSPVGPYEIRPTMNNANYQLTPILGTLRVGSAPLTVAANDQGKVEGTVNPPFSGTVSGLVLGEPEAVLGLTFSSPALLNSPPGTYPITGSITNGNYVIAVEDPGALTVASAQFVKLSNTTFSDKTYVSAPLEVSTTIKLADVKTVQPQGLGEVRVASIADNLGVPPEAQAVLGDAIDAWAKQTGKSLTERDKAGYLDAIRRGDETVRAEVLPFLFNQLSTILEKDESKLTAAEHAYVNYMSDYVREQKTKATAKAMEDYRAWRQAEDEKLGSTAAGKFAGPSVSIPPDTFLKQAQAGIAFESDFQAARVVTVMTQVVGTQAAIVGMAAGIGIGFTTAATVTVNAVGTVTGFTLAGATTAVATTGPIAIIVAAVVVGVSYTIQFSASSDYEKAMQQAVTDAGKDVGFQGLKDMMKSESGRTQLSMYLTMQSVEKAP